MEGSPVSKVYPVTCQSQSLYIGQENVIVNSEIVKQMLFVIIECSIDGATWKNCTLVKHSEWKLIFFHAGGKQNYSIPWTPKNQNMSNIFWAKMFPSFALVFDKDL